MHNFIATPPLEKAAAIFLLLILILSGYFLFSNVYLEQLIILDKSITLKNLKIAKINSILEKEKLLNEKIKSQKSKLDQNKLFLMNKIPSTASSELQNKIKKLIVTYSKAKILTIKPYPFVKNDSYTETSIEIRMKNIKHAEIQKVLYMIETNSPVFIIKELDIKRTQLKYKTIVKDSGSSEKLDVILVVSAFFREVSE